MQEGIITQTGKRKRGKNVDILPIPPKVTITDATYLSTLINVDKFFSFSQQVEHVGFFASLVEVFLKNTSI